MQSSNTQFSSHPPRQPKPDTGARAAENYLPACEGICSAAADFNSYPRVHACCTAAEKKPTHAPVDSAIESAKPTLLHGVLREDTGQFAKK
jgi:hypothetical protein